MLSMDGTSFMERPQMTTFLRNFSFVLIGTLVYLERWPMCLRLRWYISRVLQIISGLQCQGLWVGFNRAFILLAGWGRKERERMGLDKSLRHFLFNLFVIITQRMQGSMIAGIFMLGLLGVVHSLNFPLTKSRETCLVVTQGSYEFQYVISGHSEKQVRCVIAQKDRVILQVSKKSDFQAQFVVKESEASICFSSLDTLAKSVSVDFLKTDDPLRGLIEDKDKLAIHEKLYKSFQELQKVYRDQHFFLQRNFIHSILLKQTQVVVIFFMILKIMIAFVCSFFQLYYVKRILENNFSPLPSEEPK